MNRYRISCVRYPEGTDLLQRCFELTESPQFRMIVTSKPTAGSSFETPDGFCEITLVNIPPVKKVIHEHPECFSSTHEGGGIDDYIEMILGDPHFGRTQISHLETGMPLGFGLHNATQFQRLHDLSFEKNFSLHLRPGAEPQGPYVSAEEEFNALMGVGTIELIEPEFYQLAAEHPGPESPVIFPECKRFPDHPQFFEHAARERGVGEGLIRFCQQEQHFLEKVLDRLTEPLPESA